MIKKVPGEAAESEGLKRTTLVRRRSERGRTKPGTFFIILLWEFVEDRGLYIHQRRRLSRRGGQNQRRADLVRALDESDGQLRAQRHHCATPGLTGGRIEETMRLKIVSKIVEKPLRTLVVQIQIPGTR